MDNNRSNNPFFPVCYGLDVEYRGRLFRAFVEDDTLEVEEYLSPATTVVVDRRTYDISPADHESVLATLARRLADDIIGATTAPDIKPKDV